MFSCTCLLHAPLRDTCSFPLSHCPSLPARVLLTQAANHFRSKPPCPRPSGRLRYRFGLAGPSSPPEHQAKSQRRGVLHEGPALGRPSEDDPQLQERAGAGGVERVHEGLLRKNRNGEPVPYSRGKASEALDALSQPSKCKELLLADSRAVTSVGPVESRLKLWEKLSRRARLEPFNWNPDGLYIIMGAFKAAGYRSAMQYLDLAKQEHIQRGHPWTEQLALAYRVCSRSCLRALGPPKQASALPLDKLSGIDTNNCRVPGGPADPVKATTAASWWLLTEIEASHAKIKHLTIDTSTNTVSWLLPSSKTDVTALGATRRHACACSVLPCELCPYHTVLQLVGNRGPEEPVFVDIHGNAPTKDGQTHFKQSRGFLASQFALATVPGVLQGIRRGLLEPNSSPREESSSGGSRSSGGGIQM